MLLQQCVRGARRCRCTHDFDVEACEQPGDRRVAQRVWLHQYGRSNGPYVAHCSSKLRQKQDSALKHTTRRRRIFFPSVGVGARAIRDAWLERLRARPWGRCSEVVRERRWRGSRSAAVSPRSRRSAMKQRLRRRPPTLRQSRAPDSRAAHSEPARLQAVSAPLPSSQRRGGRPARAAMRELPDRALRPRSPHSRSAGTEERSRAEERQRCGVVDTSPRHLQHCGFLRSRVAMRAATPAS